MAAISQTVEALINAGVNVSVDAAEYAGPSLVQFARLAKAKGVHLTIRNAGDLISLTLEEIAQAGRNNVTLEV